MSDRTAKEVREMVDWLQNDQDHRAMRESAEDRHDLVNMLKVPDLPEHITRGIATSEPSPMLLWLARNISADILPYPTQVTITPLGDLREDAQKQADKLEQWGSLFRTRVDSGKKVTSDCRDNQMLSPYAVMILRCGDPGLDFPWTVETPDPLTCFFPIERAPFRPPLFGRRYKQLISDATKEFSGRRNYIDGKQQSAGQLSYDGKNWGFDRLGTDRPYDSGSPFSGDNGRFRDCEFIELHDGEMCYIEALNADGKSGEIVWQYKSMVGGTPAVIVPGYYSSVGPVSERMQPLLWPAMQMVYLINRVRAKRASRSDNLKPDILVEESPEWMAAKQAFPDAKTETDALESGGPNIINLHGRPTLWALQNDPDLDKQEQSYWTELNRYINSMTEVSDAEVVQDATANAFLTNLESRKRQRAPMLANLDWGWREIIKMAFVSIKEYDKEFELYSIDGTEHAKLRKGQSQTIGKADAEDIEKNFWIDVTTKSTSEAEARMRVQDWAYRKGLGISTQREGITSAGYTDETQQIEQLTMDLGRQMVTPWVQQMVTTTVTERIRLRAGIDVSLIGQPLGPDGAPVPGNTGGNLPNGLQPMRPAAVPGPSGGSGVMGQ